MPNVTEVALHGGPCNKAVVKSNGKNIIIIQIASPFDVEKQRPADGAIIGEAIYELHPEDPSIAFFLTNKWKGYYKG